MSGLKALQTEPPPPPSRARSAERAAAAGLLVLLLHALVLWIILESFYKPSAETPHYHETAITLWLTKPKVRAPSAPVPVLRPKKKKRKPVPYESYPVPNAQGFAVPPPPPTAPLTGEDYNGLRALGEYLYNCSEMNYGYLTPLDRLHCQFDLWNLPPVNPGKGLRLGKPPNSVWEQERQKQKAPPRKFTRPCRPNSPNSNLGLPCYNLAH